MKRNYTHLILILDKSGSMAYNVGATIEGVNALMKKQKALPGDFTSAVYTFDDGVHEVTSFTKLTKENYIPNGATALLDAFCHAVDSEGVRLSQMDEAARPDKVVVVVVTDGQENASVKHTIQDVKSRVATQEGNYKWQFVFLGANIDAFATGHMYGIAQRGTYQWTPTFDGILKSYQTVNCAMAAFRAGTSDTVDMQAADNSTSKSST